MTQGILPKSATTAEAYNNEREIPSSLSEALDNLEKCPEITQVLGQNFVNVYRSIKRVEVDEFLAVISPWEREYLLLNV